jgi:enamine deaminase RidA (YjgF/YER057c/UK114 family)
VNSYPAFREVIAPREGDSRVSAVQLGSLVRIRRLLPSVDSESSLSLQLESVLEGVRSVVSEAGGGLDDIARVTFFLREVKDRGTLNDVWSRWFPDPENRPPHKYVPADIPGGYEVMVDALAVLDGQRKTLKIPGVEHRDPMSMGARLGNLVFSSRLFAAESSLDRQFAVLLDQARVLMEEAGGDLGGLTQVTVFAPTPETAASMERLCRDHWAEADTRPALHVLVTDLGGTATPRMEVMGVVPDSAATPAGR